MKRICDTHALVYLALAPERLGRFATQSIEDAMASRELACAAISLWEIGMLVEKGRVPVPVPVDEFLEATIANFALDVLPITPAIAAVATSGRIAVKDPFDRLIGATALVHHAILVTRDQKLTLVPGLMTVW